MAFYARSEEVCKSYFAHKLALVSSNTISCCSSLLFSFFSLFGQIRLLILKFEDVDRYCQSLKSDCYQLFWGALALEDALSRRLPIQKEIDTLYTYLDGIEKDSVLDLVLSSLPEETRYHGTETLLQSNQKVKLVIQLCVVK